MICSFRLHTVDEDCKAPSFVLSALADVNKLSMTGLRAHPMISSSGVIGSRCGFFIIAPCCVDVV
jgi:hypothetical protein